MPVRAICELHGIPAQMGNEAIPGFWRLRETRAFVDWLRTRENGVVDGKALRDQVNACAPNAWNELLQQAIDERSNAEFAARHISKRSVAVRLQRAHGLLRVPLMAHR